MNLEVFDYELPPDRVAERPAAERTASRLMVLPPAPEPPEHVRFRDLERFLDCGDLLVINDTRVLAARFFGRKPTGGRVEFLIERITGPREAQVHARSSKPLRPGQTVELEGGDKADVCARDGELLSIRLTSNVSDLLERIGHVPLPPYIDRDDDEADRERYQTVYARETGAVAAPTAGLHFDEQLLVRLESRGIRIARVTLHVGAGTFQDLRREQLELGRLHPERTVVSQSTVGAVEATRASGGRVVAVGTTSVRALETAALGGRLEAYDGETELFIRDGFQFRVVDGLITNFHLPRSSLLMLVAAFAGRDRILEAYREALASDYRFFSYGDAMLAWRSGDGAT